MMAQKIHNSKIQRAGYLLTPFLMVLLFCTTVVAADGDLDTSFGNNGIVTTDFGSYDQGNAVAIQSDGKIVVAGGNNGVIAVARLKTDGSLDTTFDGDGMVTAASGVGDAVAIQSDGKIIVAGTSSSDFAVVRFNTDGSLDTSFDGDGMVTTDFFGDSDYCRSLAIQSDGKILAGGVSENGSDKDFAVVRYNTDGTLDTSFDTDGMVTTDIGSDFDWGHAVTIQVDGKIVIAGYFSNTANGTNDAAVVRYNTDGSLDTSFDGDGMVTTDIDSGNNFAKAVAVQSDGKIVVAGSNYKVAVMRYNTDGSLDASFDTDGVVTTDVGVDIDEGNAVTIQADGKIVVAGFSGDMVSDFLVVRYNTDGSLDASFDGDGMVITDAGGYEDIGKAVAIQSDGKIVLAGYAGSTPDVDFAVVRYEAGGSPPIPPTADAGDDHDVKESSVAVLDGSDSYDPDDGIKTYFWEQKAGPGVTLSNANAVQPTFTVPLGYVGQTMTFDLTVTDYAGDSDTDTVVLTITADACITSPNKPGLIFPGDGTTGISLTPTLQSGAYSDPGACSTHFKTRWQISEQADFSGLAYNANTFDNNLTTHEVTKKVLEPGTTYYWRVKYQGNNGLKSIWSDAFTFTTVSDSSDGNGNGVPDDQESPPNTDINENGTPDWQESNLRTMITIGDIVDADIGLELVGGIESITVETMNENATSDLTGMTGELPYGLIAFRIKTAYLGATASFKVHLQNAAPADAVWYKQDNVNGWYDFTSQVTFSPNRKSLAFTLTDGGIGDADGYVNGVIVDPAGLGTKVRPVTAVPGTPNITGTVDQASPTFTWDALANATHYYLCIQNQAQKSIFKQWYPAADVDNGDGTCSVTPDVILAPGDYYWMVKAKNEYGKGAWSDKELFTVATTQVPPAAPDLNTPTGTITDTTPEFDWDSVANADYYDLLIQNKYQKTISKNQYTTVAVDNGDGTCSINPGKTLAAGDYYWLVRAKNQYGTGPSSAKMAFTVQ